MASVNKVLLLGNLCRDPESRSMNSGDKVVSFSMATSETWKEKTTGDRKEKVQFHNVVIFNQALAGVAEQYLKKGSKVYIEGQLQTRKYTDRDNNERTVTEVVLSQFRGEIVLLGDKQSRNDDAAPATRAADIISDDIPF